GVPRGAPAGGCSAGTALICVRTFGAALINAQPLPSAETAIEDWVRWRTRGSPAQASEQTRQRQFHCGTPPPAADPRTRMRRRVIAHLTRLRQDSQLGRSVVVDLQRDADFHDLRR